MSDVIKKELQEKMDQLKQEMDQISIKMTEEGMSIPSTHRHNNGYASQLTKPPKFKTGESFNFFCERFIDHTKMNNQKQHLGTLFLHCVDDDTYLTLKETVLNLTHEQTCDVEQMCSILKKEFMGYNQTSMKQQLMNLKQGPNENITQFCNTIKEKARSAYGAVEQAGDIALLVLLRGLGDTTIRRKLNEAVCDSFEEAMRLAKHLESVNTLVKQNEAPIFKTEDREVEQVAAASDYSHGRSHNNDYNRIRSHSRENHRYNRYRSNSRSRSRNRHRNKSPSGRYNNYTPRNNSGKCYHCNQYGHYIANCNMRRNLN